MDPHEHRRVADIQVGLLVLLLQHFQDALVAPDRLVPASRREVNDLGGLGLAITVDPAVPLLEHHQRPRHVVVDQAMAPEMKVDPLRGDIGADQEPNLALPVPERVDDVLLLPVGQSAMELGELPFLQLQVLGQPASEPLHRRDPFRENDEPVVRIIRLPAERLPVPDRPEQLPIPRILVSADRLYLRQQVPQRRDFGRQRLGRRFGGILGDLTFPLPDLFRDRLPASRRTGE